MPQRRSKTGPKVGSRAESRADSNVVHSPAAARSGTRVSSTTNPPRRHFIFLIATALAVGLWVLFLAVMAYLG